MKKKKNKNLFFILVSGIALLFVVIFIFWRLNKMNFEANEIPPDYIECTVTEVDEKLLLTKVLNDKSRNYETNDIVVLDFSKLRDDQGEVLSESEIEKFVSKFKIGDNISVDFKVTDSLDTSKGKRIVKVPTSYSVKKI